MAIQIRRGTDAQWESNKSNIVAGEPAVTTDTGRFMVGTGSGTFTELAKKSDIAFADNSWTPTFEWANGDTAPTMANVSCRYTTYGKLVNFRGRFQITGKNTTATDTMLRFTIPVDILNESVAPIGELFIDTLYSDSTITRHLYLRTISGVRKINIVGGTSGGYSSPYLKNGYYGFNFWWILA